MTDDDLELADITTELSELFGELGGVLPRGDAVSTNEKIKASKGVEAPIPISVEVFDLRSKMVQRSEQWSERIVVERGLERADVHPRRGRLTDQSSRLWIALRLIARHGAWVEEQRWGDACYRDLDRLRRRARLMIGYDSPIIRVDMPCPQCDVVALIRHHGWSYVKCANCETRIDEETYTFTVRAALAQAQLNASSTEQTPPGS